MKRLVCLLLVSVLLCAGVLPASAANKETVSPCFTYIYSTQTTFSIDETTGIAHCYAKCMAASGVTIKIVGTLQRSTTSGWEDVCSWTVKGSSYVDLNKTKVVPRGYNYRFVANYYIIHTLATAVLESDTETRYYNYP